MTPRIQAKVKGENRPTKLSSDLHICTTAYVPWHVCSPLPPPHKGKREGRKTTANAHLTIVIKMTVKSTLYRQVIEVREIHCAWPAREANAFCYFFLWYKTCHPGIKWHARAQNRTRNKMQTSEGTEICLLKAQHLCYSVWIWEHKSAHHGKKMWRWCGLSLDWAPW